MSQIVAVLRAIADNPGGTIEELAESMRTHPSKVRNHVHQAKHQGWAAMRMDDVTHKPGYLLTDAGKAKLANAGAKPAKAEPAAATASAAKATEPQKADTSDDASAAASLLGIIYEIRTAISDPTGKIMLGDLAATIASRELQRAALSAELGEAEAQIAQHHDALAQLLPPDWPIDPSDMTTDDIIKQLASVIVELRSRTERTVESRLEAEAVDVIDAAKGYIVSASKRKPRRINRPEAARTAALAAVRNGAQRADVFALVPVGTAKRGAQWNAK